MSLALSTIRSTRRVGVSAPRWVFSAVIVAAAVIGARATSDAHTARAVAAAGADWAHLLRGMAVLKAMMAIGGAAAVNWRLESGVGARWLAAYCAAAAAMAAGPGLIWGLDHIVLGAALLHGGLAATLVLLWRDRAVGDRLTGMIAARRRATMAVDGKRG